MESLKINRINGLMFVSVQLLNIKNNQYEKMSILLDTGASVTTISSFILKALGYDISKNPAVVTTASGLINVHSQLIPKVKLGSIELYDVEVYAHDFPDECFSDGVIGMNVLENFNFTVNLDKNILELEQRGQII